jgi:hypothetical protein
VEAGRGEQEKAGCEQLRCSAAAVPSPSQGLESFVSGNQHKVSSDQWHSIVRTLWANTALQEQLQQLQPLGARLRLALYSMTNGVVT